MKAKELRIGNLVITNHKTDLISRVTFIQKESVQLEFDRQPDLTNGIIVSPNKLIPILLTEEWLLKFEFENGKQGFFYKNRFSIEEGLSCFFNNGFSFRITTDSENSTHAAHVKYVHQLQNLYFALTGAELILKE